METKICATCKEEFSLTAFGKDITTKSGLKYSCKECNNKKARERRKAHPERNREAVRKYRMLHTEERKEYARKYKQAHKEQTSKHQLKYRLTHSKELKEYRDARKHKKKEIDRQYNIENKEKVQIRKAKYGQTPEGKASSVRCNNKRRSHMKSGIHNLSSEDWKTILDFQDNKCLVCGCKMNDIHLDTQQATREHVIPVRRGGNTVYGNIVALCRSCNSKQGDPYINGVPDYITALMAVS